MTPYINHGNNTLPLKVEVVEEKYNAKFVCELSIWGKGGWINQAAQIYFQENPPNGYSNYFALVFQGSSLLITSADSVIGIPIEGVQNSAGEIIYSRFTHDFRSTTNGDVSVDGGLYYTKVVGDIHNAKRVTLTIKNGELVVVDDEQEIEQLHQNKKARSGRSS